MLLYGCQSLAHWFEQVDMLCSGQRTRGTEALMIQWC